MTTAKHGAGSASHSESPAALTARARSRPKHLRLEDSKRDTAKVNRQARDASGLSQPEFAARVDMQKSQVANCELSHRPESYNQRQVERMPSESALVVIRDMAAHHRAQVMPAAEVVHGDNHSARLAAVTVEGTDVLRTLAIAAADGQFTDDELETLLRETREDIAVKLEVERWATVELQTRRARR